MNLHRLAFPAVALVASTLAAQGSAPVAMPAATAAPAAVPAANAGHPLTSLPQTPSLDPAAMDRGVDPCVDFYAYSCGGWIKANPIPADKARWSVYGKLYQDNQALLWGILDGAARQTSGRTPEQQKIGDLFASCMDEAAIEAAGSKPIAGDLAAIAGLASPADLPPLLGKLHHSLAARSMLFAFDSGQDFGDASQVIVQSGAGGLGLPDRDYYSATDQRSQDARAHYIDHVANLLVLLGEPRPQALADAHSVMSIETALAAASLTRVERRQPEKLYHRMTFEQLQALTPSFRWAGYLAAQGVSPAVPVNVSEPAFYQALEGLLKTKTIEDWRAYLRAHLADTAAPYLSSKFVDEDFAFHRKFLQGTAQNEPRWKRCVSLVDNELGEALGKAYVATAFPPQAKVGAEKMVRQIQDVMAERIATLDWMGPATKKQALEKLRGMRNKIGYPAHWRDYSALSITRESYFGNVAAAHAFEVTRQLGKIGRPVDRDEWDMTPPTVNAYYDPSMNDMNFPAGVLQPPLYDVHSDEAPNYGDTGSTMGHELTHGFDDEGSRFDASGNLRNWWTPQDRAEFDQRTACVSDQYARYVIVDDVHINSKLTLGEDLADLGGTILAYQAWKRDVAGTKLGSIDGLSPDQRFFVGLAQWACGDERPESKRLSARTNPHSPLIYRINGLVANMPEFATAFACHAGQPMVSEKVCRVW